MSAVAEQKAISPRLWGEWQEAYFGSGTCIVQLREHQHKPWIYVYPDQSHSESHYWRDRHKMCEQIREFMNGGERPEWLDDFDRNREDGAVSLCGAQIFSAGPMVDVDPPNLIWFTDESQEAKDDRARLMDALFLKPRVT